MTLETERLELKPLLPGQLRLWIEDSLLLEKQLRCSYQAEPLEGLYGIPSGSLFAKPIGLSLALSFLRMFQVRNRRSRLVTGWAKEFEHNGYMTEAVQAMCE